jgi:DNA-binding CsgD family transcriptional regulator
MGDLRHGTIRLHDRAPAALTYAAARLGGISLDADRVFLDELYAAAVEQTRLSRALSQFALIFDADDACLFAAESVSTRDQVTVTEQVGTLVTGPLLTQELARSLAASQAELLKGEVARSYYMAIAPRTDGDAAMGIAALRDFPFEDADIDRARRLLPDIRRALNLRRHAGRVEALGLGVQLFDRNPAAIFITRQRSVERSNAAAQAIQSAGRPVAVVAGKLLFEDSRVNAAFELMSRPDAGAQALRSYAFVVEGADASTWIAQLSPARQGSPSNPAQGSSVVVALTPFNTASQTREATLSGFTDLTPTERSVFAAFVDGQDIPAIATRMNRSVETIRWHVRNLFTKLGVNSQADLARLGALLLPI